MSFIENIFIYIKNNTLLIGILFITLKNNLSISRFAF